MPNIWAHIQFGREAVSEGPLREQLDARAWKTAFQLGCQGPDFLFYHRFLPWQASTDLNRLGNLMHGVRCGPFLLSLMDGIKDRDASDPAFAFSFGFLLHHVLDRNLHPFVFSRSGFRKWHHQRYETAMDAVILHRRAGISTGRVPVAPEIDAGGGLPGGFSRTFHGLLLACYPALAQRILPEQLDEAVRNMVRAQRLFFDPAGWKRLLLRRQLEPFSPPRVLPDWDVLNDARRPWVDPTDRTRFRTESADDLWDAALADARETGGAALAWLLGGKGADSERRRGEFARVLGDVSYETGLSCGAAAITFADSAIPV
ncbi:zinc dependent phospholipase C family protein [Cohnella caldifontis]|uniref:zinc dependent phospholipase C family protein n=1 Tax=Cohnella caldifontis TaxID=3027471 RepID=UPI0023EE00D8|nr:zinc dependent phospholipase C family protein [Cohnella sp. YIM B05605]